MFQDEHFYWSLKEQYILEIDSVMVTGHREYIATFSQ